MGKTAVSVVKGLVFVGVFVASFIAGAKFEDTYLADQRAIAEKEAAETPETVA